MSAYYACGLSLPGGPTPEDLGLKGYQEVPCPRCARPMWRNFLADAFLIKFPDGEVICLSCCLAEVEAAGSCEVRLPEDLVN